MLVTCPNCAALVEPAATCPHCGTTLPREPAAGAPGPATTVAQARQKLVRTRALGAAGLAGTIAIFVFSVKTQVELVDRFGALLFLSSLCALVMSCVQLRQLRHLPADDLVPDVELNPQTATRGSLSWKPLVIATAVTLAILVAIFFIVVDTA